MNPNPLATLGLIAALYESGEATAAQLTQAQQRIGQLESLVAERDSQIAQLVEQRDAQAATS